jgi:hypothetical protein
MMTLEADIRKFQLGSLKKIVRDSQSPVEARLVAMMGVVEILTSQFPPPSNDPYPMNLDDNLMLDILRHHPSR